ncbi:MAG: GPW/gp25 family protein [Flavobacteriales bacterium]
METKTFLGQGWKFPPSFSNSGKTAFKVRDLEDIIESIGIILNTQPGERLMRPEFGCNLRKFVFDLLDSNFITELNHEIYYALLNFEPRIDFIEARVAQTSPLEGIVQIEISFSIIITNTRHNIVFPYYLLEGTNI